MARPLRIEFPGAIYHVMARGNARQALFPGDDDYQRMLAGLEKTVQRTGWEVFSLVWMPKERVRSVQSQEKADVLRKKC